MYAATFYPGARVANRARPYHWASRALLVLAFLVTLGQPAKAQKKLTAAEAKDHIGENGTVCGAAVSAQYVPTSGGQPTFLNLDNAYPKQVFTIVIWGKNRSKFGAPEDTWRGKRICVSGRISAYEGVPEIIAEDPQQIKPEK